MIFAFAARPDAFSTATYTPDGTGRPSSETPSHRVSFHPSRSTATVALKSLRPIGSRIVRTTGSPMLPGGASQRRAHAPSLWGLGAPSNRQPTVVAAGPFESATCVVVKA